MPPHTHGGGRVGRDGDIDEVTIINPLIPIPTSLRYHRQRWKTLSGRLSPLVKDILTHGAPLLLDLKRVRPRRIRNIYSNEAALKALDTFIESAVQSGYVTETEVAPTIVSPIMAIPKKDSPNRWRILLDLRYVNQFQKVPKFRQEGIETVNHMVSEGCFMTKLDLKDGFFHIPMRESHHQYLGFQHRGRNFIHKVLPQGSSSSPWIFCKMLRPVVEAIRSQGIKFCLYVDDGLICSPTAAQCLQDTQAVLTLFKELGWHLNEAKCQLRPTQCINFLGFSIDCEKEPVLRVPYQRKRSVRREVINLLKTASVGLVPNRQIARVAGLLTSLARAIHPTPIFVRHLLNCLPAEPNWTASSHVGASALNDLISWLDILQSWRGELLIPRPTDVQIESDASDSGWAGVVRLKHRTLHYGGPWTLAEKRSHINQRELLAAENTLRAAFHHLSNKSIHWKVDSMVAMSYMNKMTGRKAYLAETARRFHTLLQDLNSRMRATYIPSEENTDADSLSRDLHDWEVTKRATDMLESKWGPFTIDRFASPLNSKCKRFNSRRPYSTSTGVDAMSKDWNEEAHNYAAPPLPLLSKVALLIKRQRPRATLVVPYWPAQPWFTTLQEISSEMVHLPPAAIIQKSARWTHSFRFCAFQISGKTQPGLGLPPPGRR